MRIIAVANQKGGVGKTTSTVNIGSGLSKLGKKCLLIDLDPQANLTSSSGFKPHELKITIYQLLKNEANLADVLLKSKNGYSLIPASLELSGAEIELSGIAGRELLLKEAIEENTSKFDYILIDCPPSLGILTLNAFTTANEVFIPLQAEYLATQGMSKLFQTIEIVKKRLNRKIEITGIIATLYDSRKKLNREVIEMVIGHFEDKLFNTYIRDNVSLAEAPSHGQDIFRYKKDSSGAIDYMALSQEILKRHDD